LGAQEPNTHPPSLTTTGEAHAPMYAQILLKAMGNPVEATDWSRPS
jgi:hypothetical protein